jgi:SAM-dependent methyltransferase
MNEKEKSETIKRYNQRLEEFGYNPLSLGWGEKNRANLRFEILLSQWDFNRANILDFGCGFGDLHNYMKNSGIIDFSYTGVDINENLIKKGLEVYPGLNLINADWLESAPEDTFDYILSSGVFNHKLEDNFEFITKAMQLFNRLSKKGFALNFLSDKVEFEYDYTYHASPSKILEMGYLFSNKIVLRNDYMPYEFTLFVNKQEEMDLTYAVYPEYMSSL